MCGIAGIVRTYAPGEPVPHHLESIPERWLDVLDESIKHRGPDGQGRFRDRAVRGDGTTVDVAFVHRRLSIIDHADGHQPMVHDGKRLRPDLTYQPGEEPKLAHELAPGVPIVAVVFNGCIYNHRELRAELEAAGHRFGTDHSDTEVLVHATRAWGLEDRRAAVERRLNGMYAWMTWNRADARHAATRDPFGEKPLYWNQILSDHSGSSTRAFSSVPTNLRQFHDPPSSATVPSTELPTWIRFGFGSNYSTRSSVAEIWPSLDQPTTDDDAPLEGGFGVAHWLGFYGKGPEALDADRTETLLRSAVHRRLESDVPLGCFLSGGIDSALITRFAHEELGKLPAFTVRMPASAYDESGAAAESARAIGADLEILDCHAAPAEDLVALIERCGLPFGDSSMLPTHWVCRAAAQRVKVALSGDGGDELFCGYERHIIALRAHRYRPLLRCLPSMLFPDRNPKLVTSKLRRFIAAMRHPLASIGPELASIFPRRDLQRLIETSNLDSDIVDAISAASRQSNSIRKWDIDEYLRGDLLRKTDTASMHVPIEVRCPFLDPELAEAAIRTPLDLLMPGGQRKGLLKQVARRYLPDHIVDRPKRGFAIPIGEWFRTDFGGMRQLLHDHLDSTDPFPGLAEAGVNINMRFVRKMLREHDAAGEKSINPWHGRDHSQRLYMLLVLSIWTKWLAGVTPGRPGIG